MRVVKDDAATRLRIAMDVADVNVNELADMTGLSRHTITRIRTGQITKPNWETKIRICDALGVRNPRDIFGDSITFMLHMRLIDYVG